MAARDEAGGLRWTKAWTSQEILKSVTGFVAGTILYDVDAVNCDASTVEGRGELMTKIGSTIGKLLESNEIRLFDMKWRFQPYPLIERPTELQIVLSGCVVVVLDYQYHTGQQPACSKCNSNAHVKPNGWATNARSVCVDALHTMYIVSRGRRCSAGEKN